MDFANRCAENSGRHQFALKDFKPHGARIHDGFGVTVERVTWRAENKGLLWIDSNSRTHTVWVNDGWVGENGESRKL